MLASIDNFLKYREIKKFLSDNRIDFNGFGGFNVNNLVVDEFGYLLKYVSKGHVKVFDDLEKIYKEKDMILTNINNECAKNILREEENLNISHETAVSNMLNLKGIIIKICSFVEKCHELNLNYLEVKEKCC